MDKMGRTGQMEITGLEANFLLFCLDAYCGTDIRGKVKAIHQPGYSKAAIQDLRDRLMAIHEHPEQLSS
jgi:hypothetical protein